MNENEMLFMIIHEDHLAAVFHTLFDEELPKHTQSETRRTYLCLKTFARSDV